jgi:hypothetical protein
MSSFVFSGKHLHDNKGQSIAAAIHYHESPDRHGQTLGRVEVPQRVASPFIRHRQIHARQIQISVLIEHECLISVLEEGDVLELDEEDGDVALIDEEPSEEHEGDDEDGSEGDSELFVGEQATDDQGIAACSDVDVHEDGHYIFQEGNLQKRGNLYMNTVLNPMA